MTAHREVPLAIDTRVGGDDVSFARPRRGVLGSSPRWRGRLVEGVEALGLGGLIPALAGTTNRAVREPVSGRAHPRVGGDDCPSRRDLASTAGSSPRWRGRPVQVQVLVFSGGLIPALAGTTPAWFVQGQLQGAHPRAGGDDDRPLSRRRVRGGSSPRWRGRRDRGGSLWSAMGSSPRWRGRPASQVHDHRLQGLTPALAGTTAGLIEITRNERAHPRVGGDDVGFGHRFSRFGGSSPRWRGRLLVGRVGGRAEGLIPALAGTT